MLGLIYKDVLVLKKEILLNLIVVILFAIGMDAMITIFAAEADDSGQMLMFLEAIAYLFVFVDLGGLQNNLFESDENTYYSSFVVSTPLGKEGQVLSKYYLMLIISFVGIFFGMVNDLILSMTLGELHSGMSIYLTLFFIQIFLRAIDTPFLIRYGQKYGKNIKLIMISVAIFLVIVYGLFGPLPEGGIQTIIETVANWLYGMEDMSVLMMGVVAVFPYLAVAVFYISYKVSVKMYLKGVANYE